MKKHLKEVFFQREPHTYAPGKFQVGTISWSFLKSLASSHSFQRLPAALNMI